MQKKNYERVYIFKWSNMHWIKICVNNEKADLVGNDK